MLLNLVSLFAATECFLEAFILNFINIGLNVAIMWCLMVLDEGIKIHMISMYNCCFKCKDAEADRYDDDDDRSERHRVSV